MASLPVFGANCATSHLRQLAKLDQAFGKGMPSHQRHTLFGAFNPARRISRVVDLSATHARGDERPSGLSTRHGWTFSTTVVATSLLVASPLVPLTSAFLTCLIPARANFSELRSSAPATHARCCSAMPNRFVLHPPTHGRISTPASHARWSPNLTASPATNAASGSVPSAVLASLAKPSTGVSLPRLLFFLCVCVVVVVVVGGGGGVVERSGTPLLPSLPLTRSSSH